MKIIGVLTAIALTVSVSSSNDVMKKSMSIMSEGMSQIQQGFLHNNVELIKSGAKLVKDGNSMFSDKEVISKYLSEDKRHMINVAENAAKRINLDVSVLELNLDTKSYISASNAYSDMLNACARCHSIVRSW